MSGIDQLNQAIISTIPVKNNNAISTISLPSNISYSIDGNSNNIKLLQNNNGTSNIFNTIKKSVDSHGNISSSGNGEFTAYVLADQNGDYSTPESIGVDPLSMKAIENIDNNTQNSATATDRQLVFESKTQIQGIDPTQAIKQIDSTQFNPLSFININPLIPETQFIQSNQVYGSTEDYRCSLMSTITGDKIIFRVTPNIDESGSASYDSISPIHHPGTIQIFRTSTSRSININAKLISRTIDEATETIKQLNLIRSWRMPYYGTGTRNNPDTKSKLGAPPDVLTLSAYGKSNLHNIPCVLASYSWTYPDDIDYIPTSNQETCPRIIDISITLSESYSPEEFSKFDLTSYRKGQLDKAYNGGTSR